ncbi:hypothetical protein ACOBQB_31175 [Streptomyces sp. G5(2025)]|uniref:hypothetical protein n=1 Tax=Streptomyces sp. G5(2025) TaxID=3406628 RepID=UPI003C26E47E
MAVMGLCAHPCTGFVRVRTSAILDARGVLTAAPENTPEFGLVPRWAEEYMDPEREAIALSWYDNQVLPGLDR